jgi:serine/threonine-protein kinase
MSQGGFDYRAGDQVAGSYLVIRPIGLGASAAVYRAKHLARSGHVALKVMHETDPSGVGKQRFEREAALVQKLRHPHVVQLLDYGHTEAGQPFIAFELLEGSSLRQVIKGEAPLEPLRIARVALEVLDALDAAHRLGIVHRDIKPANIFMSTHGSARVLDFGLAKALFGEEQELLETLTRTGYRLGTPRYMSPEMARGHRAEEPSDVYSFGLVMAEMIAGSPIVAGNSQIDVLMAHASADQLALGPAVMSSPFAAVVQRAVAKSLAVRYPSAMQMRADVVAVAERLEQDGGEQDALSSTLPLDDVPLAELRAGATVPIPPQVPAFAPSPPLPQPQVAPPPARQPEARPLQDPRPAAHPLRRPPVAVWVAIFAVLALVAALVGYLLGG